MRAFSDNEDLALLSGINPERVVPSPGIVAALATIAGVLYGLDKSFKPFTYFQLLLPIFAAAIVGGLGNPVGAIARRVHDRVFRGRRDLRLEEGADLPLPEPGSPRASCNSCPPTTSSRSFIILVIVLLFRPTGLFKGKAV
jgi:branched-chain amino acid transport system permease protein